MKLWHPLAVVSGSIIAVAMALASISYNATLGTAEPAFPGFAYLTNSILFASLALAFDLGMIASVFAFLRWRDTARTKAFVSLILFLIASGYSIHSVRGYIATNFSHSQLPAARSADIYASLRRDLEADQDHLAQLRTKYLNLHRRSERARLRRDIAEVTLSIDALRKRLAHADPGHPIAPLAGLDWFLALTLWFFNATCWAAWFNSPHRCTAKPDHDQDRARYADNGHVTAWLNAYDGESPAHCAQLLAHYRTWCAEEKRSPLTARRFYAELIALGAKKFRDGRSGPIVYLLPAQAKFAAPQMVN